MIRKLAISALALASSGTGHANETPAPSATYILQVASNLNCAQLDVQLLDPAGQSAGALVFHTGAFAATELAPGTYALGTLTCHDGDHGTQAFDHLKDTIAPFSLASGQAYFGGELILQATLSEPDESAPDVVSQCIRGTGRFRKEPADECRDGVGIATERVAGRAVSFYAPRLEAGDLDRIRAAFSATEAQLRYLPLEVAAD